MLGSAGSYLDGGANSPLQRLALPLMDMDFIRRDAWALQKHFRQKRDFLLTELEKLGIRVQWSTWNEDEKILCDTSFAHRDAHTRVFSLPSPEPTATFYVWADISGLPQPLNDCLVFLEECVKRKVICVVSLLHRIRYQFQLSNRFSHISSVFLLPISPAFSLTSIHEG